MFIMRTFTSRITKVNYLYLLLAVTVLWILINLWYIIYNVYSLNNGGIVDTTTALQSIMSSFYHEPFVNTVPGGSYFSVHASEILYVLLPFFAAYRNFMDLYVIQSILIYSASIPLFLLARKKLNNDKVSFLISLVYLLNPYIHDNPFETLTLFMGFIIYSYYFFDSKKYLAFIITFLLALSTMEFNPVIGGFFGLYLILLFLYDKIKVNNLTFIIRKIKTRKFNLTYEMVKNRYLMLGIFILIISISFFYLDKYIILYFSAGKHLITTNLAGSNTSSISAIFSTFKNNITSKINSLMDLNAPFLFLSFLDPFSLLELPWFAAYSITTFAPYWSVQVYYDSYIIPFAAIAAVLGLGKLKDVFGNDDRGNSAIKKVTYLAVLVTVILLMSNVVIPMVENPVTPVNSNDYGVDQLAALIPGNASVYTGVNNLPIVSSHAYNTWFYGPEQNYVLFNITSPPDLTGYGFVAASGSYALYEKDYIGKPDFNNMDISGSSGYYRPGGIMNCSITNNYPIPLGDYKLSMNINYTGSNIITYNENANETLFLNDSYALVYPFTLSNNFNLGNLVVDSSMIPGYYILQSMITSSTNPNSTISSVSYGHNQYNFKYEDFNFNGINLSAGKTYYLWLWSSGDPGGLTFPVSNNTSTASYIAKIYNGTGTDSYGYKISHTYSLQSSDYAPKVSLVSSSPTTNDPSNLQIISGNNTKEITVSKGASYSFDFSDVPVIISSNLLNGSLSISYSITSLTGKENIPFIFEAPYVVLAILILLSVAVYPIASIIDKNTSLINLKYTELILIISLITFYSVFSLYYYRYIDIDLIYFKIIGIIISISFFAFILKFNKKD